MKYMIIGAALILAGCDEVGESNISTFGYEVKTVEVEGHKYIIYSGYYKGNIIHSESCPCKGGKE
nr:MAG TPA: TRAF PROTEIN, TRAO PROTEIN, TRAN ADHESION, BACTERIAL SECRETION.5A [Caudoviricetes sp.]